tara:strand:- start:219 stop:455 length:237 start_codon:yes stop_codon:yes gene_type:complete
MLIVIPYPNGEQFIQVGNFKDEEVRAMRKEILEYVDMTCTGPWESDELDILFNGIRVRVGSPKDFFMLKLKYGEAYEY